MNKTQRVQIRSKVFRKIASGHGSLKLIDKALTTISVKSCKDKLRMTMEEAAARFHHYGPNISYYLCPRCGWVHAGHEPKWVQTARDEFRHETHKRALRQPKWMSDPRRSAE